VRLRRAPATLPGGTASLAGSSAPLAAVVLLVATVLLTCSAWVPHAGASGFTVLTATVDLVTVPYEGRVLIRGTLRENAGAPLAGASVSLLARGAGEADFIPCATGRTDMDGVAVFRRRPHANTTYRLDYGGDLAAGLQPSTSSEVAVSVRSRVTLAPGGTLWAGELCSLIGRVDPARPAGSVVVVLIRQSSGWVAMGNTGTPRV
jgi:hypothetical protein